MINNLKVKLPDMLISFSRVLDIVSPKIANHHLRVAVIANEIAQEAGLSRQELNNIFLAAIIHDIGFFSVQEKFDALELDMKNPHLHAERGYLMARQCELFSDVSKIIRCHHIPYDRGEGCRINGDDVPLGGHIIHLADRIEVLIDKEHSVLDQKDFIIDAIKSRSDTVFKPEFVEVFEDLALKESLWFDASSPEIDRIILDRKAIPDMELDIEGLLHISKIFGNIIDYRSPFTAVHSAGVSAVATLIAQMMGFSDIECRMMKIAGHLHDIGKLAVPVEIIDKPAGLTTSEFNIIKSHVYHSYRLLEGIGGLETINIWGALHHERIDGTGYPFHVKGGELPLGSRIMGVADVFTALTEDRPYRKGMRGREALRIIEEMAKNNVLDHSIVGIAVVYFKHLDDVRIEAQREARAAYLSINQSVEPFKNA